MGFGDVVAIVSIAVIVGAASYYLLRAKKKGKNCLGCPYADSCSSKSSCCSTENNISGDTK